MNRMIWAKVALCFIIAICLITACSGSESDELFDHSYDTSEVTNDMGGYSLLYKLGGDAGQLGDGCLGYANGTPLEDEARTRLTDVQSKMNCTIKIDVDPETYAAYVTASTSGTYYGDAIWMQSDGFRDIAEFGGMVGITGLDAIDYTNTEKWGNSNILEVFYVKDDLYGLLPCLWPEKADSFIDDPMVVNENLIARLSVPDPRDYIENGDWTWNKFIEVLPTYYAEEGGEVKHYGLAASRSNLSFMMLYSDGIRMLEKNTAGNYVFCMYTDKGFLAMNKTNEIIGGDVAYTFKDIGIEAFVDDGAVLGCFSGRSIIGPNAQVANEMDNFGVLSFPVGPDAEPGYKFSVYHNLEGSLGLSVFAKDIDATAAIIDAIYEPISDINSTQDLIGYLRKNYFFDDRDADNYIGMVQGTVYDYFHYGFISILGGYGSDTKPASQYIESSRNAIDKVVNEQIIPSYDAINAVWGEK